MDRGIFGKEKVRPIQRQIAINLVGRDLVIARNTILAASIHQHARADDICLQENRRILNAAIHMALRCEVHHDIWVFLLEELIHCFPIADVYLAKAEILLANSDLSVKDVAYSVGFSDQMYFSRVFKKLNGRSPTGFREKIFKSR